MVVGSTLSFLAVNSKLGDLTKGQLVEMAMENERRVGPSQLVLSCFHKYRLKLSQA